MKVQSSTKIPSFILNQFLMALLIVLVHVVTVSAQTTTFTYQGRLTDGETAASATYDMQFKLFDTAGVQLGATITNGAVVVTNGVFTVQLDYGATAFSGNDRLLEISVRPAGNGDPYTTLSPRQPITSTPYAIRAANTTTADTAFNSTKLGGVNADQYVLTTDPRLAASGNNFIQNGNVLQAASFNITGTGEAANLKADHVYGDSVDAGALYKIGGVPFISNRGFNTTVIGTEAGTALNIGPTTQGNTLVGTAAGKVVIAGTQNTFVGAFAGSQATTTEGNSFFGYNAGKQTKAANRNSFFGQNAGQFNVTGTQNSFFGNDAGLNSNSHRNSFFGETAGRETTDGMENSFFGASAGRSNTTGQDNSFFGYASGESNTTAQWNSFFGVRSGNKNTTGMGNSIFGYDAGKAGVTSSDNSYFGAFAGAKSTGSSNAMFGYFTGPNNSTGFANSFFGMSAGELNQTGFNHTFFGRGAGVTNVGGNNNTIIGAFADVSSANLTFATAIGSGATVNSPNTIVLGRNNGSDGVQVPGTLTLGSMGTIGVVSVCRNALNQLSFCSSSLRYKTNIAQFTGGLALLNKLKPITFQWKSDNSADLGFGAEDVAAVEPLLAVRNDLGEVEGVKYDRISAVLVNAVKEQQAQIAQQQQLLQRQQAEIQTLKRLVYRRRNSVRR